MRSMAVFLALIAAAASVWAIVAAFRMGAWLTAHGVKINWLWYRATFPWYVERYKRMTTETEGKTGPLFVQFLVAINLALLLGLAAVVALVVRGK